MHTLIGNDIVDLRSEETIHHLEDRHENHRFIERVFTATEQKLIHATQDPLRTLWSIWAAKEAAYKVMIKQDPSTIFAHQKFEISSDFNSLRYADFSLRLQWEQQAEFVHCIATYGEGPVKIFSRVEELAPQSTRVLQSLSARKLAHAILHDELKLTDTEIQGVPPEIWISGHHRADLDLSLSHHESWTAAVIVMSYNH